MKATFVITHGSSSRASRPLCEAKQVFEEIYGKDVYMTVGVHDSKLEESIRTIRHNSEIVSIDDKTIEIGPYFVHYKLILTR